MTARRGFWRIAASGVTFQAGSAAVDSATIMSALVFQLTGSTLAVGAVTAILRFGWLSPQLIVGYLAGRGGTSMRFYVVGAFGRALCMMLMALVLFAGHDLAHAALGLVVLTIWTAYAFVSGIVAVPYNDIVARAVPSEKRSRLLATRFFGGGLLALGAAALADRFVGALAFPASYGAITLMASGLMLLSSGIFSSMGEPAQPTAGGADRETFSAYLAEGWHVFRGNRRFRRFVVAQWCGGAVLMAAPFYVVQAHASGVGFEGVALLLGAQTAGALMSNPLWGWWGDRLGKAALLRAIATARMLPPAMVLLVAALSGAGPSPFYVFVGLFFVLGALANGLTIAVIGFLMEISPDDRRPAFSGYFNALTAPAVLLPLAAGGLASVSGLLPVFALALGAAALQAVVLLRIGTGEAQRRAR